MKKNLFSFYIVLAVIGFASIFLFPALAKSECAQPEPSGVCIGDSVILIEPNERPGGTIVEVVPGAAELVSPSGTIATTTPTYIWKAVSYSTWYYLWVNDSTGNRIKQWYAATEVGCPSGTGNCTVTPTTPHAYAGTGYLALAPGVGHWWVQTFDSDGYGPWSAQKDFYFDQYGKYCQNISAAGFAPDDAATTYSEPSGWKYRTAGTRFWFDAPLHLPAGAQITQIYVTYYDNNASGDVWVWLFNNGPGGALTITSDLKSSETPGYGTLVLDLTSYNVIVDNIGHSYLVRVRLDATDSSNRFRDAIVCYTPSP